MFRTVVPLAPIAVEKVGPQDTTQVTTQVATQVTTQVAILAFCKSRDPRRKSWNIADIKTQRILHKSTVVL